MTPEMLATLRLQMQVLARDVLLEWLARRSAVAEGVVAGMEVPLRAAAEQDLHRLRQEFLELSFPEHHPAESDLRAAEAQEAFDAALAKVRASLSVLTVVQSQPPGHHSPL